MRAAAIEWMARDHRADVEEPRGFHDRFCFIPLREQHLNFMRAIYGTEVPSLAQCYGRTMVTRRDFMPMGTVSIYFEPDRFEREYGQRVYAGRNWLYAHFAHWLRVFPKDILRAMSEVCDEMRARKIFILHASADENIEGSDYLLEWLGAVKTKEHDGIGWVYRLDLRQCKI